MDWILGGDRNGANPRAKCPRRATGDIRLCQCSDDRGERPLPTRETKNSDVANLYTLLEGGNDVRTLRDELLGDVAGVTGVNDRPHDCRIIQFLRLVDFRPARDATGVIMGEVLVIG